MEGGSEDGVDPAVLELLQEETQFAANLRKVVVHQRSSASRLQALMRGRSQRKSLSPAAAGGKPTGGV